MPSNFASSTALKNSNVSNAAAFSKSTPSTSKVSAPDDFAHLKEELLAVADPQEKEYRTITLAAIERTLQEKGPHTARAYDSRARQFMPFAALKGYSDMVQQEESENDKVK